MGAALLDGEEKRIQELVPDGTHVPFDGIDYSIHRDDPINFRRVLFDFLDTISEPNPGSTPGSILH